MEPHVITDGDAPAIEEASSAPAAPPTAEEDVGVTTAGNSEPEGAQEVDAQAAPTSKEFFANIYPGDGVSLPEELGRQLARLRDSLGMPVWLLLQGDPEGPLPTLDEVLVHIVKLHKAKLPECEKVAVVINSPGGRAVAAYELARLLRRKCGGFTAVIPDEAMSAATLLALGADEIIMGGDSVLGPLDAQVWDPEAESYNSVLNEVQALERLRAYSMESIDETMVLLVNRTGKRVDSLLPHVLKFVSDSMRPLLEKIDVVHYNERARILKVAEEYAVRLLRKKHPEPSSRSMQPDEAREIASKLVENYPEHEFRIHREEAKKVGLDVASLTTEQDDIMDALWPLVQRVSAIGLLIEKEAGPNDEE